MDSDLFYGFRVLLFVLVLGLVMAIWARWLMRIRLLGAFLMSLGVGGATTFFLMMAADHNNHPDPGSTQYYLHDRLNRDDGPLAFVSIVIMVLLATALVTKVYSALVLDKATEAERKPGMAGVRAWLSPVKVIAVIALSVAAYIGLDYSIVGTLILGISLLLIYPLIGTLSHPPEAQATVPQAPAEERQRVLALVEAGKISAEDAAELLSALAQSQAAGVEAAVAVSFSPSRRIMLAGAAVTLLGFLLPWFTINITRAMNAAIDSVAPQIQGMSNGMPSEMIPQPGVQVPTNTASQFAVRGGDIHNGLGWVILTMGLGAAGLPFFWPVRPANAQQHRNAVLSAIGVGTVALLYVLSGSFNAMTSFEAGFIVTIAGYVLLWVGAIREYLVQHAPSPLTAPAV
jgi:hypothetical protein